MVNFFKPSKDDGTVLHLTKSGKWEKCTIPVGCTRHIDPKTFKNYKEFALSPDKWSEEAYEESNKTLSVGEYNGYDPEDNYDEFEDMRVDESYAKTAPVSNSYELKRVNYHYTCPECKIPFEPVKTVSAMDAQVAKHDCDNLTPFEMHKKRKLLQNEIGVYGFMERTRFASEHDQCKSYQTACAECAEKHELKLYEMFSREELETIVRKDSMFYNPAYQHMLTTTDVTGAEIKFLSHATMSVLSDFPGWQKWEYLPDKNENQLQLERKGINYGNHIDDEDDCRVCGHHVYDMYCMDCWTPSGYLLEENNR